MRTIDTKKVLIVRTSTVPMSLRILLKGQLSYLNKYFEVVGISSQGLELAEIEKQEGIKTYPIKMERKISPVSDIASIIKMIILLKKLKPYIIHSITPKAGLLSMIAGYFAGIPIRMHTFTGLIFPSRKGFMHLLLKNMDRLTCAFATHIIPEGEGVKHDLISYSVTRKPLKVIGNGNVNGINIEYFSNEAINEEILIQTRMTWQITPDNFVYIFAGRLVKDKGINELVAAFNNINKQYSHTKLLLVGDYEHRLDPLYSQTLDLIKNHLNIIHVGFQSDIRSFLAVSNVLVFPSYREGFPNVPMQAGAMGLPCIVTDINGCNEIIKHNVNGIIIPPKKVPVIENAMLELLVDNEKYKYLAKNARPLIIERYEEQTVWQLIKEEYDAQLKKLDIIA